jgi:DNA-binding CsgD family transcriptional regulator
LALVVKAAPDDAPDVFAQPAVSRSGQAMAGPGWRGLFDDAFRRSRNAMVLANDQRVQVDVNSAYAQLLGRRPSALIGHPLWEFVEGGPLLTPDEWQTLLLQPEFVGSASMKLQDGDSVQVQWAGHPELVTGRRLVLFVALSTHRAGRHFRRQAHQPDEDIPLSDREAEIIRLIALGESGPEIADQLHISHNTVRTHVRNAMTKTGARSRAHLVAKALGAGLVLD